MGVVVPFGLGYLVAHALGLPPIASVVAGATLTATSVGITARVLSDVGRLSDLEGQVVLGAAVIDDVLGLIILAVITRVVQGGAVGPAQVLVSTATAFAFLAAALVLGQLFVPRLFTLLTRIGKEETLPVIGLALALLFSLAAEQAGSALIVGAFAAGLVLQSTRQAHAIESGIVRLAQLFVPIFFVAVGAAVNVRSFGEVHVLLLGGALLIVGILGKVVAGYAPWWFRGQKLVIGIAMVPCGRGGADLRADGAHLGGCDQRRLLCSHAGGDGDDVLHAASAAGALQEGWGASRPGGKDRGRADRDGGLKRAVAYQLDCAPSTIRCTSSSIASRRPTSSVSLDSRNSPSPRTPASSQ